MKNILKKILEIGSQYIVQNGYKQQDYFKIPDSKFVIVNIGMIARLTYIQNFPPGTILNPITTIDLETNGKKNLKLKKIDIIMILRTYSTILIFKM